MFSRDQDLTGGIGAAPLDRLGPAAWPAGGVHDWGPDGCRLECARCGVHLLDAADLCEVHE